MNNLIKMLMVLMVVVSLSFAACKSESPAVDTVEDTTEVIIDTTVVE